MSTDCSTTTKSHSKHDLYKTGDLGAPASIKDNNGEVVLGLCKKCGRGEVELSDPCGPPLRSNWIDDSNPRATLTEVMDGTEPVARPQAGFAAQIANVGRCHDNDWPLWQGPSGEGWNGGVTQSMLVRFLSCRERFRLKYVLGLEPPDRWDKKTGYGNMWHVCEEEHAANRGAVGIVQALHKHTADLLRKYPYQQEEIAKWHAVCSVQFPEYVKFWQEHPDVRNRTPLLQEQVFDVPYALPSGRVVRLRGKWDSVDLITEKCSQCDGTNKRHIGSGHWDTCGCCSNGMVTGVYLQENKSKGDIDKLQIERQLKFDLQTMLYLVALTHTAHPQCNTQPMNVNGVRYNVVRRPLSGGKGNISPHKAKATKTKVTPAETSEQFYERLRHDYIAAEPDYWFFRVRGEVSQHDVKVFRETCLDPLLENVCCWYDLVTGKHWLGDTRCCPPLNYRTPFGVWSALEENGSTEYDAYLQNGSESGLRRVEELFTELKSWS